MKFSFREQLYDIQSFNTQDAHLLYISNGILKRGGEHVTEGADSFGYCMYNDVVAYIKEEKSFIGEVAIDKPFVPNSFNNFDSTVVCTEELSLVDFTMDFCLYSLRNNTKIGALGNYKYTSKLINTTFSVFLSDEQLVYGHTKIGCLERWQFDISEIGEFISPIGNKPAEVEQLIGVYGQILWVYLGNGKLIGLDAQTGKLVHELNDTPERNIHGGTMRPLADGGKRERFIHFYLDQTAGKLIGLSFNTYCEVDLKLDSPSFEFWILKEQMPSWGLKEFAHNTAWDGHNSLFFFDANAHLWGVFDITQRQIVWVSDPISIPCKADSFTQLREIQCGAGKVYVLDSSQTLHVFEKSA